MRRFVAALNAIWFVLSFGAPQLLHPCPEHSPKHAVTASAHAEHAAHASHAAHHDASKKQEKKGQCCCPGPQCCAPALELVAATPAPEPPVAPAPVVEYEAGSLVRQVARLLPFATAPPASIA